MMLTYLQEFDFALTEGQLVLSHHGRPERAWVVPESDGLYVISTFTGDFGAGQCHGAVLSDGRTVVIADDFGLVAAIYPSLAAAQAGDNNQQLEEA